MGLLAYKDPANSPLGHLVSSLQNQAIADKVNDAVLGENGARNSAVWVHQLETRNLCKQTLEPCCGTILEKP